MFEQLDISPPKSNKPLKVLAIGAVGLLLGIGFCGLDAHLYPNSEFGGSVLALLGAVLVFPSILVTAASVLALLLRAGLDYLRSRRNRE